MRTILLFPLLMTPMVLADTRDRKLIEFGWTEPDTAFMRAHAAEMGRTPFDGC